MANIAAYLEKAMLDWVLGGAAATQPASRLAALSLGVPTSVSGSEVLPNSGYAAADGALWRSRIACGIGEQHRGDDVRSVPFVGCNSGLGGL